MNQTNLDDIIEIRRGDARFPPLLAPLVGAPHVLFVRGNPDALLREPIIAVVGTRKMTNYGRAVINQLVPAWVRHGITVVSGLALGTDAAAHAVTLESGGRTVAVLGSGIDDQSIAPRTNATLAADIIASGGALVSEYPSGTPAAPHRFPERNRIVAGLARAVVVIEGSMKSGTLITAKCALEYGRDVFAVPGQITHDTSAGTNWLISQGARPLTCARDLLEAFDIDEKAIAPTSEHVSPELSAALTILRRAPTTADHLSLELDRPLPDTLVLLSDLEMQGAIKRIGDTFVAKV